MTTTLDEARSLLDHVGRTADKANVALHALAAAGILERPGPPPKALDLPIATDRELLARALRLLGEADRQAHDEDVLAALEHTLLAHQATR